MPPSSPAQGFDRRQSRPVPPQAGPAILWGGVAAGVLDISAALVVYGYFGLRPLRLLQGIAAGLLGTRAFDGGVATALLGLFFHFVVAFSAAATYFAISRLLRFLTLHPIVSGAFYGVAVYFFMQRVVLPLSEAVKYPFSFKFMVVGIVIHIFCVGLPISISNVGRR
jgi:hypothetical protein